VGLGSKREGRRRGRRTFEVFALGLEAVSVGCDGASVVCQPSEVYLSRWERGMDFSSVV
jgi:hypothetical protein